MKRTNLIKLLEDYHPTQEEINSKEDILNFIKANKNCFERTLEIGHITASAWLINKDNTKVLLTHHAKLDRWLQLGGHCDGNHNVLEVAIKEAQEESGIAGIIPVMNSIYDIGVHLIPERESFTNKKEKAHYHYDIRFLLKVVTDEEISINSESKELRWIEKNIEDLPTDSPAMIRMFNKWINIQL